MINEAKVTIRNVGLLLAQRRSLCCRWFPLRRPGASSDGPGKLRPIRTDFFPLFLVCPVAPIWALPRSWHVTFPYSWFKEDRKEPSKVVRQPDGRSIAEWCSFLWPLFAPHRLLLGGFRGPCAGYDGRDRVCAGLRPSLFHSLFGAQSCGALGNG